MVDLSCNQKHRTELIFLIIHKCSSKWCHLEASMQNMRGYIGTFSYFVEDVLIPEFLQSYNEIILVEELPLVLIKFFHSSNTFLVLLYWILALQNWHTIHFANDDVFMFVVLFNGIIMECLTCQTVFSTSSASPSAYTNTLFMRLWLLAFMNFTHCNSFFVHFLIFFFQKFL